MCSLIEARLRSTYLINKLSLNMYWNSLSFQIKFKQLIRIYLEKFLWVFYTHFFGYFLSIRMRLGQFFTSHSSCRWEESKKYRNINLKEVHIRWRKRAKKSRSLKLGYFSSYYIIFFFNFDLCFYIFLISRLG